MKHTIYCSLAFFVACLSMARAGLPTLSSGPLGLGGASNGTAFVRTAAGITKPWIDGEMTQDKKIWASATWGARAACNSDTEETISITWEKCAVRRA